MGLPVRHVTDAVKVAVVAGLIAVTSKRPAYEHGGQQS